MSVNLHSSVAWLTPVILATWKAKIRTIMVTGQSAGAKSSPKLTVAKWTEEWFEQ
jgi:hypothetical protein